MLLLNGGCGGEEEAQSSANPRGSLLGRGGGIEGACVGWQRARPGQRAMRWRRSEFALCCSDRKLRTTRGRKGLTFFPLIQHRVLSLCHCSRARKRNRRDTTSRKDELRLFLTANGMIIHTNTLGLCHVGGECTSVVEAFLACCLRAQAPSSIFSTTEISNSKTTPL